MKNSNFGLDARGKRLPVYCVIDGEPFIRLSLAFGLAKSKGYKGTYVTFRHKVNSGVNTWDELLRYDEERADLTRTSTRTTLARKSQEVADSIAALEARKQAIREAQRKRDAEDEED